MIVIAWPQNTYVITVHEAFKIYAYWFQGLKLVKVKFADWECEFKRCFLNNICLSNFDELWESLS